MKDWLGVVTERSVVVRALKTAALVGVILIAINQGSVILSGNITGETLIKMAMTVIVPYLVSTSASVGAMRNHRQSVNRNSQ